MRQEGIVPEFRLTACGHATQLLLSHKSDRTSSFVKMISFASHSPDAPRQAEPFEINLK